MAEDGPLWRRLHQDLHQRLRSGNLLPGMRLPSEQALADQWGTSRQTVRTALLALHEAGAVRRRVGQGWFVAERGHRQRQRGLIAGLGVGGDRRSAITDLLADHDLDLVDWKPPPGLDLTPGPELASALVADARVRGVLVVAMRPLDERFLAILAEQRRPVVVVGFAGQLPCDTVACDFAGASRRLVHAAHARGRRRIAFAGRHLHAEMQPFRTRVDGYVATMHGFGLTPRAHILPASIYRRDEEAAWFAARFADDPADAVILDVSSTADVMIALHGQRPIPDGLAVAGYGNSDLPPGLALPVRAMDAVFEPWDDLFICAARRLLARLDGDDTRSTLSLVACDLIPGDSGFLTSDGSDRVSGPSTGLR